MIHWLRGLRPLRIQIGLHNRANPIFQRRETRRLVFRHALSLIAFSDQLPELRHVEAACQRNSGPRRTPFCI